MESDSMAKMKMPTHVVSRTIAKLFDSRRPPRRQQNAKVETVDSSFRGIDGLGTDSIVWKDFAIVLKLLGRVAAIAGAML